MITVRVKLFATLRRHRPGLGIGEPFEVDLPATSTIADLIDLVGLPPEEVKIVFVNGLVRQPADSLSEGDELGIFPPVGGG